MTSDTQSLDQIIVTHELESRMRRFADYKAEAEAMSELAKELTNTPDQILVKLSEVMMRTCDAGSAGVSLLEEMDGEQVFRWRGTAGAFAHFINGKMPRFHSPCGTVVDSGKPQLMKYPARHYTYLNEIKIPIYEVLLVPFSIDAKMAGTLWVAAHTPEKQFDAEDLRALASLSHFAAASVQVARAFASEQVFLKALLENLSDGIVACDAEGRLTVFNKATRGFHGLPEKPLSPGKWASHYNLYEPDCVTPMPMERIPLFRALTEGRVENAELCIIPNGRPPVSLIANGQAITGPNGERLGAVVIMRDQTELQKSEAARLRLELEKQALLAAEENSRLMQAGLERSEARSRLIIETIPQGIWRTHPDGSADYFSERFYELVGYSPSEFLGWGWSEYIHPEDRARVLETWQKSRETKAQVSVDFRILQKSGAYRWFLSIGNPFFDEIGEHRFYYGTWTDIHDVKTAQEQMRESEAKFRTITDAMPQMVWSTLADGYHDYYNKQWYDFTGLPEGSTDGDGWNAVFHPDDRERAWKTWKHSLQTGENYEIEYRLRHHSGEYRWALGRALPVRNENGVIIRWMGTRTDIHEKKLINAELWRAKDEAERANQLKSAFLANMSHEIRTPLGAMIGFADLLRDPSLTMNERSNYIDILTRNGEQLPVIINDILDLSKVEAGHLTLEYLDASPDQIAADAVSLLRVKAKEKDLSLDYAFDSTTPRSVVTDPTRLRQILLNLVGNAIKFTNSGFVRIKSYGEVAASGAQLLCFEVSDSGIGIPETQREKVFEMFVQADGTTTRRFGGTGLGLALSRQLARALGGDLAILATREGVGTTFRVSVPDQPERRDERVQTDQGPAVPELNRDHALEGVRVLVVDDAPDNQQLIGRYLKKQGAIVESAENGLAGFRAALTGDFDLVLMDVQMPIMDGYTATEKLRGAGYKKPIIALTAHAMSEVRKKCLNVGYSDHLTKPINSDELIGTIARFTAH